MRTQVIDLTGAATASLDAILHPLASRHLPVAPGHVTHGRAVPRHVLQPATHALEAVQRVQEAALEDVVLGMGDRRQRIPWGAGARGPRVWSS